AKLTLTSQYVDQPRVYSIIKRDGRHYAAYRMVLSAGLEGQYYGVQGTTWTNPPILGGPHDTKTIHGRQFQLYWDGTQLRLVAWKSRHAVYWISNTLLLSLSNRQMMAIAASTRHL